MPAAHVAARLYAAERARGVPEGQAWAEAVQTFRFHHPAWPLPLAEREAVRLVGALIGWRLYGGRDGGEVPAPRPLPLDLAIDLVTPDTPEMVRATARCAALGLGGVFRDVGRVPAGWHPVPHATPLLLRPAPPVAPPG